MDRLFSTQACLPMFYILSSYNLVQLVVKYLESPFFRSYSYLSSKSVSVSLGTFAKMKSCLTIARITPDDFSLTA